MSQKTITIEQAMTKATWPLELRGIISPYFFGSHKVDKNQKWQDEKSELFEFIYHLYTNKKIYLSDTGPNDDHEREDIDTLVIHHSKSQDRVLKLGESEIINRISLIQMLNLYANYFSNPLFGEYYAQPMYSGHYYEGKQTFVSYHWLIFPDGKCINTLDHNSVGWHSYGGNGINRRSIGICILGDFTNPQTRRPNHKQILACRELIKGYQGLYPGIKTIGHKEVPGTTHGTICPGSWFLDSSQENGEVVEGWKRLILP